MYTTSTNDLPTIKTPNVNYLQSNDRRKLALIPTQAAVGMSYHEPVYKHYVTLLLAVLMSMHYYNDGYNVYSIVIHDMSTLLHSSALPEIK